MKKESSRWQASFDKMEQMISFLGAIKKAQSPLASAAVNTTVGKATDCVYKKEKIGLDCLVIEVTRRCNMQPICAHCFRGDPQHVDLNFKAVDNLLSQISDIGDLTIAGGEPLLNLPAMRYIFSEIKNRKIKLEFFSVVTNGLTCPPEFLELIVEINDYISQWISKKDRIPHVTIGISQDRYHKNGAGESFTEKCNTAFAGKSIAIVPQLGGMNPFRTGKAVALPCFEADNYKEPANLNAAIDYWEPGKGLPTCTQFSAQMVKSRATPLILCQLYLSATGLLYPDNLGSNATYTQLDQTSAICNLNIDEYVLDGIKAYNAGRETCRSCWVKSQDDKTLRDLFCIGVDEFVKQNLIIQNPAYGFPPLDRKLAYDDLQKIIEIYNEYNTPNLYGAFMIWMDEMNGKLPFTTEHLSVYGKFRADMLRKISKTIVD